MSDDGSEADYQLELVHEVIASDLSVNHEDISIEEENEGETSTDAHGPVQANTSFLRTLINFLKSYIGSGILGLPYAFYKGGIILSIFSLLFLALLSNYCIRLLLACSAELEPKYGKLAFGGIGKVLFGNTGRIVVDICLVLTQVGFCCVYVIFMSGNMASIFPRFTSWEFVIALLPFLILVCWLRSFKWLAILSFIGQITGFVGLAFIMLFAIQATFVNTPEIAAVNVKGIPIFFGMVVYTYEGIGLVIPMKRAMKEPKGYGLVLDIGYIGVTLLFLAFGVIGYTGFGDQLNPNAITLNLPQDSMVTPITQFLLVVSIFCTYPVQMFPVITILEGIIFSKVHQCSKTTGRSREAYRNLFRSLLVIVTSAVAITIPYFSLFASLIGALGSSSLAFIMPCVFHLKLFYHRSSKATRVVNILVCFFGIIASVVSSGVTIWLLFNAVIGNEV